MTEQMAVSICVLLMFGVLCTICLGLLPSIGNERRERVCFVIMFVLLGAAMAICVAGMAGGFVK